MRALPPYARPDAKGRSHLYADTLAARASALAARVERERDAIRRAALERAARRELDAATVARLEALGILSRAGLRGARAELTDLTADLAAIEALQAWVEARLLDAGGEDAAPAAPLRRAG